MPYFFYKASNRLGRHKAGCVEAIDEEDARETLESLSYSVEELRPVDDGEARRLIEEEALEADAQERDAADRERISPLPPDDLSRMVEEMLEGNFLATAQGESRDEKDAADGREAVPPPAPLTLSDILSDLPDPSLEILSPMGKFPSIVEKKPSSAFPDIPAPKESATAFPTIPERTGPSKSRAAATGKKPPAAAFPTVPQPKAPPKVDSSWSEILRLKGDSPLITPRVRNILIAALIVFLVCVGLIVKIAFFPEKPPPPPAEFHRVQVTVSGRVKLARSPSYGEDYRIPGLTVIFHFPEVPVEFEKKGEDVLVDSLGNFEATFRLVVRRVPTFLFLTVKKEGYMTRHVPKAPLAGNRECAIPGVIELLPVSPLDRRPDD